MASASAPGERHGTRQLRACQSVRSITKSWPRGLFRIAASMAAWTGRVGIDARNGVAQIGAVLLAQAHVEHAGAGEAHAVAAFAEIMGEGRDQAQPAAGFRHVEIARRAAGAMGARASA